MSVVGVFVKSCELEGRTQGAVNKEKRKMVRKTTENSKVFGKFSLASIAVKKTKKTKEKRWENSQLSTCRSWNIVRSSTV